jgi:hypothetical protein
LRDRKKLRGIICVRFLARHKGENENSNGTINMKIQNDLIAALGSETQCCTALVRSLDSSLGNMLEKMTVNIPRLNFTVSHGSGAKTKLKPAVAQGKESNPVMTGFLKNRR